MADTTVDVLLVGAGVASARCARTLRRHGFDGSILIVGNEPFLPYNRPPLSKELLREELPDDLVLAEPPSWYERRGVEVRPGSPVSGLDLEAMTATLDDGTRIAFSRCLLATGAEPRRLPIEGAEHVHLLRTLGDARALRAGALAAGPRAPVTVIGGGFIGIEVASSLAALGLRPTVVEMANALWAGALGSGLAEWGMERLRAAGVQVRLGAAVERVDDAGAWIAGQRLDHALVVAGIGVRPRTALAEAAGLAVDDGIVTDANQRTSHPRTWAAGDVARVAGTRIEHWHAAREQGERAALDMLDLPLEPMRPPWVFTEVAGISVDLIGTSRPGDEEAWVAERSVVSWTRAGRLTQLASIASALPAEEARRLVSMGAGVSEVEPAVARDDRG